MPKTATNRAINPWRHALVPYLFLLLTTGQAHSLTHPTFLSATAAPAPRTPRTHSPMPLPLSISFISPSASSSRSRHHETWLSAIFPPMPACVPAWVSPTANTSSLSNHARTMITRHDSNCDSNYRFYGVLLTRAMFC